MGLFNNPPWVVRILILFVIVFALGMLMRCHAAESYVQLSGGSTYIRGPAPVLDVGFTWIAPQSRHDFWKTDLTVIGSSTFRGQPAPNNFAVRGLYVTGFGHFDIGLGLAWLQNPAPYNGSPVNFTLELAYRFQRIPITITGSHISNAGTQSPNYGRDFLTIGYRFKG
jgi:hypothetical protein